MNLAQNLAIKGISLPARLDYFTSIIQLCDNPLIDNDFSRLRAPEFAD